MIYRQKIWRSIKRSSVIALLIAACTYAIYTLLPSKGHNRRGALQLHTIARFYETLHLDIKKICVLGNQKLQTSDIAQALSIPKNLSILALDLDLIRTKVRALPWVHDAMVHRNLTQQRLIIKIIEHEPFCLFQRGGSWSLVSTDGRILDHKPHIDLYTNLPRVTGEDAPKNLHHIYKHIMSLHTMRSMIAHYQFVNKRRWNILLHSGTTIALPEDGIQKALENLTKILVKKPQLLHEALKIDLRILDRVTIQYKDHSGKKNC